MKSENGVGRGLVLLTGHKVEKWGCLAISDYSNMQGSG